MATVDSIVPDRVQGERIHVFDKMEGSGACKVSIPDYSECRREAFENETRRGISYVWLMEAYVKQ